MIRRFYAICVSVIAIALSLSCSSVYDKVYPTLTDGKYDSEFPYKNSSGQLEEISRSVKLLNSIAFYTSYVFAEDSRIIRQQLRGMNYENTAKQKVMFNRTASGTATIIGENQGTVALLTVAHIVAFPDTLLSFFFNADGSMTPYIQSVSIKVKQTNYIPDFPDNGEVEIIAFDKTIDVAILGQNYNFNKTLNLSTFNYPWGSSSELEWGSFVYVFGFPMNYKMVSKGIVSSPQRDKNSFLIDAVFNKGYSGGIVLAIRDGVPNFELVGLVRSVPAEYELIMRPLAKTSEFDFNPMIAYKGETYVEKEQVMRTGITKVTSIEVVRDFIVKNRQRLIDKGYYLDKFFNVPEKVRVISPR